MLNLILAVFWLLFAIVAFAWPALNPDMRPWVIPGTDLSMGWFLVVLAIYNVVRWRTMRTRAREDTPLRTLPRPHRYDDE
jgi:hypothetical protein